MTVFVVECGVCATFPCAWAFVLLITGAPRAAAETNTAQASSLGVTTTTQKALSTSSVMGASSQPDTNKNKLLVATAAASPAHRAAGPGRRRRGAVRSGRGPARAGDDGRRRAAAPRLLCARRRQHCSLADSVWAVHRAKDLGLHHPKARLVGCRGFWAAAWEDG